MEWHFSEMAPLYNLEMYSKAIENNFLYEVAYEVGSGTGSFDREFWIFHFLTVLLFLLACGFLLGRYRRRR